tara:strand:- start:419 stop:754 length:336 start_codon:yes stop_codon:yes gene_type:complete
MTLIDTYQLATSGQNFVDTFTLASNGILIDITITPIPPRPRPIPGGPGGSPSTYKKEEEKHRKKITVIVTINQKKYKETVIVEDQPNLAIEDINVDVVQTEDRPQIKITVR